MIKYIKGDLFAESHKIIVHGVNCQGVMGSGIAKIIREKWPEVYDDYHQFCQLREPYRFLGLVRVSASNDNKVTILNCFTQLEYGKDGKRYMSYDAVDDCMKSIASNMVWKSWNGTKISNDYIAMPKIGAGLGGGHWPVIEAIINHRLKDHKVKVYEL